MKVDMFIQRGEGLTLEVETAFCTLVYDIEEVCKLTLTHLYDFSKYVIVEEDEDRIKNYDLDLDSLNDNNLYDLLHDLVYYHDLKPIL
jgi:hypothetical protein